MKKHTFLVTVFLQASVLLLCAGIFSCVRNGLGAVASAAEREAEPTSEAPEDLAQLLSAGSEQLDVWAEALTSFDGRDYGYITSQKNQYDKNICWAYAAVGAAEASILREGIDPSATKANLDLDEYVAAYVRFNRDGQHDPLLLTTNDRFSGNWNQGDFSHNAFAAMSQGCSPVGQKTSYYSTDETIKSFVSASEYFVQSYFRVPNTPEAIKRAVLQYGAVTIEYKAPDGYYDYYYNGNGRATNHASIIVGWDDNIGRSRFYPSKPSGNGAWIVKNSWGSLHGKDDKNTGAHCYYLSYETYLTSNLYAVDLAMKEDYQNLYYYDGQLAVSNRNYLAEAQAAIFEAKLSSASRQEQLKAVTVESGRSDIDANIKVYRHLTVNPGNVNDEGNIPVQGAPVAERNVHLERQGLHTIDLAEPVDLEQGEYFSIVVSCTDAYGSWAPLVCAVDGGESVNDMTYHLYNGEWTSYKQSQFYADTSTDNMSARIRAVTNTVPRETHMGNDLRYARVEIPDRLLFYARGQEQIPEIEVYFGDVLLRRDRDYTVKILNNTLPGMATVQIDGTGSYFGTRTTAFEVAKLKYPPNRVSETLEVYNDVTSLHQIPIPVDWEWVNGDYELEPGLSRYAVSLKYVGADKDFYQITTCDFYINKIDADPPFRTNISAADVEVIGSYTYTGSPVVPSLAVTCRGQQLYEGVHYTVTCRNNTDAGQAAVTVTGKGQFSGEKSLVFEIGKAEQPPRTPDSVITVSRKAKTLRDVSPGCEDWQWKDPASEIVEGLTATAVYVGADRANYKTIEFPVGIVKAGPRDIATVELGLEETLFVYDGREKTPQVIARDEIFPLAEGTDFRVLYQNNKNAGKQATVTVVGINDYVGSATLHFEIGKAEREGLSLLQQGWIFGTEAPQPVLAGECEPADVTYLYSRGDGSFTAEKPVNAGTYRIKAVIAESQNYRSAEAQAAFEISPKGLSGFTLTVEEAVYTGRALTPKVFVKDKETDLVENVDFSVSYENNIRAGRATAAVRGIGNYTGTLTGTFEIQKANSVGFDTTIRLKERFETLSDVALPEDFVWDETSLVAVSDRVLRATAVYTGENYAFETLEFEIVLEDPQQDKAQSGDWMWLAVPAAVLIAAGAVCAFVWQKKKRH